MSNINPITIVSGAGRGIGRSCAEQLAQDGHRIIGLGRSNPEGIFPGEFFQVDFADRNALTKLCKELAGKFKINGIVNNVGDPGPELIEDISFDTVDRVMEVNFYSAIQLVQTFSENMKEQRYGRIVSISSELALGLPTRTVYGGAKAALISATRTWALELAQFGVTANAIAPGPVNTEFFNQNNPPGSEVRIQKENKIPVGRIGEPEDVARVTSFLMDRETSFVTGQTLFVDGGSSLGATGLF